MNKHERLLGRFFPRGLDTNIRFVDLCALMRYLGSEERIRASHHLDRKEGVADKVNMQRDDGDAKSYQVRQVRLFVPN